MKSTIILLFTFILCYGCDEPSSNSNKTEPKTTKIAIGNGETVVSQNFQMKLNIGKVASTESLESENHKLKVGVSTIEQR